MLYLKLGSSDLRPSAVGCGTGQYGTPAWGYGTSYGKAQVVESIRECVDFGITLFDTAETYGLGMSEILLGESIKSFNRDHLVLVTKVAPWNLYPDKIEKALEGSLRRLGVRSIDLYLVHYPNPFAPMKMTFRSLERLVGSGKIRFLGVSNFNIAQLEEARNSLASHDIVVDEIEFNILSRRAERTLIPHCRSTNTSVIAYSPLAGGVLAGTYDLESPPRDRGRAFNFLSRSSFTRKLKPLMLAMSDIGRAHEASVAQIAVSYVTCKGYHAIPAPLTPDQARENARAGDIRLSQTEIGEIERLAVASNLITYTLDNSLIRPMAWIKEFVKRASHLVREY